MSRIMSKLIAGAALVALLPSPASSAPKQSTTEQRTPEQRTHPAPGFADFIVVDGKFAWTNNRDKIQRWSRDGKVVAEVAMHKPCGSMVMTGHDLWVADCADRTINRVDTRKAAITATVATGLGSPDGELAVTAGAGSIWVASDAKGVIARVDPATRQVIASIPVDPDTFYLAYAFGALWAVSDSRQSIQKIDPATNRVIARAALGLRSSFLAAGDDAIWVVEQGGGTVARVDPASGSVTGRVKIGDSLKYSDIDAGGGKVWVRTRAEQVFVVVDPQSATVKARVGQWQGGGGLRYTPQGLWTTQHDQHTISWWPNPAMIGN